MTAYLGLSPSLLNYRTAFSLCRDLTLQKHTNEYLYQPLKLRRDLNWDTKDLKRN